jgi:hypothetical protein
MARYRIKFVRKRGIHHDPHERIQAVGGDGWRRTVEEVIRSIENGFANYDVQVSGRPVEVVVSVYNGRKYLKSKDDGYAPVTLLNLPDG